MPINKMRKMDCFNFLKKIDDGCVDLAVIDPPYNLKKADWDTFKSEKVFLDFTYSWIDALLPKLKENGSLYIF
ncbi:MAG: DNA methyltransferase, partial [Gammaproteobacteria bacterium]